MSVVISIAWRNLFRHKGKSFVIGSILFLGAVIMTVGNAIVSGLDQGLALNFRQRLTGDIVVVSTAQLKDNVFFTPMGEAIESIANVDQVVQKTVQNPMVAGALPAAKGVVMVLNEDSEPFYQMLFGVNYDAYTEFFPDTVQIIEGTFPTGNTRGLILSTQSRDDLRGFANLWPVPVGAEIITKNLPAGVTPNTVERRDQLIYMGFSDRNTSLDIITPVRAIGKYAAFNGLWGKFSLIDIDSFNDCMGYFSTDTDIPVSKESAALLNTDGEALDDILFGDATAPKAAAVVPTAAPKLTSGYNVVFVRLKPNASLGKTIISLNKDFKADHLEARAISWKDALGQVSAMALLMRAVLFIFVMIVFFVAIIIITNTLSLAAIERITEIGMMRAVGAQRRFISGLFIVETSLLSVVFGGAGIAVGALIVKCLAWARFKAPNEFVELFFGGPLFHPILSLSDLALGLGQLLLVTILAMLYPIYIARRISPMDAITRE